MRAADPPRGGPPLPSFSAAAISAAEACRIALFAQGFGRARPGAAAGRSHVAKVADSLGLIQIDSVNVLSRAHTLPPFARLGAYDRTLLDAVSYGAKRKLFEYWAHEASLLPLELHPLMRWRMARADRGEGIWGRLKPFAGERRAEADALLARIAEGGPITASALREGKAGKGWWVWSDAKTVLEFLFWAGHVTTSARRSNFERVYDLPERALPAAVLALPTPPEADAHRALLDRSAAALGVATARDLRDYFRLKPEDTHPRIAELVEAGRLRPVRVEGWRVPAYLHADAHLPRRVKGDALIAPFDPLVFERSRAERLFGVRYRIEIYVPAALRQHGYYVLPFLMDGEIVARVDLKADRRGSRLVVQSAHAEPGAPDETAERLAAELGVMAGWLGLEAVAVAGRTEFAKTLDAVSARNRSPSSPTAPPAPPPSSA